MRVCDRHPRTPATDYIHIQSTEERIDLCSKCTEQIRAFIRNPKQEEVEEKSSFWKKKIPA